MGFPWNWVSAQWSEETRMMGLPDGRKSFKIGLAILIPACDRHLAGQPASQPASHPASQPSCRSIYRAYYVARVKTSRTLHINVTKKQETQLWLTNLLGAFIGQSMLPNIVPFHYVRYSFLLCSSNFVVCRFYDIRLQKCHDLEIRVRGHSGSLKVVPFYRSGVVSY